MFQAHNTYIAFLYDLLHYWQLCLIFMFAVTQEYIIFIVKQLSPVTLQQIKGNLTLFSNKNQSTLGLSSPFI